MTYIVKKLPYEEFKYVYERVPRLCVDLVVKDGSGVLLSRRDISPGEGMWHMPGGTVLKGESISDTLSRVAMEEAGIEISNPKLVGIMEFSNEENPFFHTISLVHEVTDFEGKIRGSKQGREIRFHEVLPEHIIEEQKRFLFSNLML